MNESNAKLKYRYLIKLSLHGLPISSTSVVQREFEPLIEIRNGIVLFTG